MNNPSDFDSFLFFLTVLLSLVILCALLLLKEIQLVTP